MFPHHTNTIPPSIAIIDENTLAALGLKQILHDMMPMMMIEIFNSLEEMKNNETKIYFHFFISTTILLQNYKFFTENRNKTIVLTTTIEHYTQFSDFHTINVNSSESELIKSILKLEGQAHPNGKNIPDTVKKNFQKPLSKREIDVLSLIVKGYINKEIADVLNIGLTTVITHRKHIVEKLGTRSVSALTIYAVMNGYVNLENI